MSDQAGDSGGSGGPSGSGGGATPPSSVGDYLKSKGKERLERRRQERTDQQQAAAGGPDGPDGPEGGRARSDAANTSDVGKVAASAKDVATSGTKAYAKLQAGNVAGAAVELKGLLQRQWKPLLAAVLVVSLAGPMLLVLLLGGVSSAIERGDEVTEQELPTDLEMVYREAVGDADAEDVPWTIVAGLAHVQTEHGRFSPYDTVDRDPGRNQDGPGTTDGPSATSAASATDTAAGDLTVAGSTYPVVTPAIGGDADEGAGPFLLAPTVTDEVDDPQDVADAAAWVADQLQQIHDRMEQEGIELPDDDPVAVDEFWAEAIDRLSPSLADSTGTGVGGCAVPSDLDATLDADGAIASLGTTSTDVLPSVVDAVFRCQYAAHVEGGGTIEVATGVDVERRASGDTVRYRSVDGAEALQLLIDEAATIAQAHVASVAGDDEWTCPDGGPGWFPLDDGAAATLEDPCDVLANVQVAARLALEGVATPVAVRAADDGDATYGVMLDGWRHVSWALGPAGRFATDGPAGTWSPGDECRAVLDEALYAVAGDGAALAALVNADATSGTSDPDEEDAADVAADAELRLAALTNASLRVLADAVGRDLRLNPVCALESGDPPGEHAFYRAVADQLETSQHALLEAVEDDVLGSVQTDIAVGLFVEGLRGAAGEPGAYEPGVTATLSRLNPDATAVAPTPRVPRSFGPSGPSSLGLQVVPWARWYGGTFDGDEREGTRPTGGLLGGAIGGMPLVIEADPKYAGSDYLYPHPDSGDAVYLQCGSSGSDYVRPEMARLWERMCTDAAADGVRLVVSSSTRSYEQQAYLKRTKGSLAASPGNSRHERGAAIDVGEYHQTQTSGGGVTESLDGDRSWMHTVVGCYDEDAQEYRALADTVGHYTYAARARVGDAPCGEELPIKRVQTYGLMAPLCAVGGYSLADPVAIDCKLGTGASRPRENWHIQPGIPLALSAQPVMVSGCGGEILQEGFAATDKQSVAQTVYRYFYCRGQEVGWENRPSDYPPFTNLAEQVAAEAVAVAECESGLDPAADNRGANTDGTTDWGLFQFNDGGSMQSMGMMAPSQALDPISNTAGAWRFRLERGKTYGREYRHEGTWQPWVCAGKGRYPVQIGIQDATYSVTRSSSVELPVWAIDPFTHPVD